MHGLSNKIIAVVCCIFFILVGVCAFSAAAINRQVSSVQLTTSGRLTCLTSISAEQDSSECNIGLKTDSDVYYSLENYPEDYNTKIGNRVQITGNLKLESDDNYNTSGSIDMQAANK